MQTATKITNIATAMIPVEDQDAAIAFYTEKLGFELRADTPFGRGERWVEVAPAGAQTPIALVRPREGEAVGIETRLGLRSEDVESDQAALKARGVDVSDVMRMGAPVPPMCFLRDQDGNQLMIVQLD